MGRGRSSVSTRSPASATVISVAKGDLLSAASAAPAACAVKVTVAQTIPDCFHRGFVSGMIDWEANLAGGSRLRYSDAAHLVIGIGRYEVPFGGQGLLGAMYVAIGQPERCVEWCRGSGW